MASTKFIKKLGDLFVDERMLSENALRRYGITEEIARDKAQLAAHKARRAFNTKNIRSLRFSPRRDNAREIEQDIDNLGVVQFEMRSGASDRWSPSARGAQELPNPPVIGDVRLWVRGKNIGSKATSVEVESGPFVRAGDARMSRSLFIPEITRLAKDFFPNLERIDLDNITAPHRYSGVGINDYLGKRFIFDVATDHIPARLFEGSEDVVRPPTRYLMKLASIDPDKLRFVGMEHPRHMEQMESITNNPRLRRLLSESNDRYGTPSVRMPKTLVLPRVSDSFSVETELGDGLEEFFRSKFNSPESYATLKPVTDLENRSSKYIINVPKTLRGSRPYVAVHSKHPVDENMWTNPMGVQYPFISNVRPNSFLSATEADLSGLSPRLARKYRRTRIDAGELRPRMLIYHPRETRKEYEKVINKILKRRYWGSE